MHVSVYKHVLFPSHSHLISILYCDGAKSNKILMLRICSKLALAYISYADPVRFSVVKSSQCLWAYTKHTLVLQAKEFILTNILLFTELICVLFFSSFSLCCAFLLEVSYFAEKQLRFCPRNSSLHYKSI